jgi:hypothetical protein
MQMYEALEQRVRSLCNYLFYASIKLVSVNLKVYGINFSENNMLLADLSLSHILRLAFLYCIFTCGYDQIRFSSSIIRLANYILSLDYFINNYPFLTVFIPTHPVNFSCGRKPEHREKTHDFR